MTGVTGIHGNEHTEAEFKWFMQNCVSIFDIHLPFFQLPSRTRSICLMEFPDCKSLFLAVNSRDSAS